MWSSDMYDVSNEKIASHGCRVSNGWIAVLVFYIIITQNLKPDCTSLCCEKEVENYSERYFLGFVVIE